MTSLPPTLREIAPPKDPESLLKVEQEMRAADVGPVSVRLALSGEELGHTDLGGAQSARLFVEPEGLSRASGGELYVVYGTAIGEAQAGQQGEIDV